MPLQKKSDKRKRDQPAFAEAATRRQASKPLEQHLWFHLFQQPMVTLMLDPHRTFTTKISKSYTIELTINFDSSKNVRAFKYYRKGA